MISTPQNPLLDKIFLLKHPIFSSKKGEYYWKDIEGLEVYTSKDSYGICGIYFQQRSK